MLIDTLIIKTHRENPSEAQSTIAYLITYTNQQATAARAIAGITAETLQQCQTPGDIAATQASLAGLPADLLKPLVEILPKFRDISQDVKSALQSKNPYRQAEFLSTPIRKLEQLNTNLATQSTHLAITFGSSARHWLRILQDAQTTLQKTTSNEIPSAYLAGIALDPDRATTRFKGRQDIFDQIETLSLSNSPPIFLLCGGRRIGKTSSLKYLPERMGSDIIPLFVGMQGLQADDPRSFVTRFAQEIQTSARTTRNYNLPPIDAEAVRRDPFPALQQWFTEVENCIDRTKRILLCIDEFERLDGIFNEQIHAPLNFFRHVMQHRQRWILLFSGSTHPDDLQSHWNDCLINARSLHVSYLDEPAARELIRKPIPDFPDIYDPATVDRIIHLTHCQPFWVQTLCSAIVEILNNPQNPRTTATVEDVETALGVAMERGRTTLNELWGKLSDGERDCCDRILPVSQSLPMSIASLACEPEP
ncbi:MAG: hypothetical protein ACPGVO_21270 [Spirulinaceae cyanobacterium]